MSVMETRDLLTSVGYLRDQIEKIVSLAHNKTLTLRVGNRHDAEITGNIDRIRELLKQAEGVAQAVTSKVWEDLYNERQAEESKR